MKKKLFIIYATVIFVLLIFFGILFKSALFQEGNPLPVLSAILRLQLSNVDLISIANNPQMYITRTGEGKKAVTGYMESKGWTYKEQFGAGFLFEKQDKSVTATSRQYSRFFSIWKIPIRQISGNNIYNSGIAVSNGVWEFYRSYTNGESGFYKIKTGGFNKIKVTDDAPAFINLFDGWLYYSNLNDKNCIYKIKTDGTGSTKLTSKPSLYLNVKNGWIYYVESEPSNIYRMRLDGSGKSRLSADTASFMVVDGIWVYYANTSDGDKLYRIKMDGTSRQKICEDSVSNIIADHDYVYYKETLIDGALYRIKTDGSERLKLIDENVYYLSLYDGWLYYCKGQEVGDTARGRIFRAKIYIYHEQHFDESKSEYKLQRISTDGTNKKIIK